MSSANPSGAAASSRRGGELRTTVEPGRCADARRSAATRVRTAAAAPSSSPGTTTGRRQTADSGEGALSKVEGEDFDVVVLDILMPEMETGGPVRTMLRWICFVAAGFCLYGWHRTRDRRALRPPHSPLPIAHQ